VAPGLIAQLFIQVNGRLVGGMAVELHHLSPVCDSPGVRRLHERMAQASAPQWLLDRQAHFGADMGLEHTRRAGRRAVPDTGRCQMNLS
jgi:hypothetical protein